MMPGRGAAPDAAGRHVDPVVEAYKPGVDVTLIDRNLRLTPSERLAQLQAFVVFLAAVRAAGDRGAPTS